MLDTDSARSGAPLPHGPRWKRMHHCPFFWVATVCIGAAGLISIMSIDLPFWPGEKAQETVPAVSP